MINISNRELTGIERKVLEKGAGFAIADKRIAHNEYVAATEEASGSLPKCQALALKAEVAEMLQEAQPSKCNLSSHELKALKSLKKDENIVITPADKGKALVVMNREDYVNKIEEKLTDTTTYIMLDKEPTQELSDELKGQLNHLLNSSMIDENLKRQLYPKEAQIPGAYGSPKITRKGIH